MQGIDAVIFTGGEDISSSLYAKPEPWHGIEAALTARLALECLERGKVPFYCAAWSNIPSVRNAIKAGFRPAWAELTVKSIETVNGMNA